MVNDQTFRTPNKHVTHYGQRPDFPYSLTNTLPTIVNDQTFRTPNKHVTHYTMVNDQNFRTPNKHVTHYGQRPDFPYT